MGRIKATALERLSSEPEMDSNCDSCLFCIDFKMSDDCVFGCHVIYEPHKVGGWLEESWDLEEAWIQGL